MSARASLRLLTSTRVAPLAVPPRWVCQPSRFALHQHVNRSATRSFFTGIVHFQQHQQQQQQQIIAPIEKQQDPIVKEEPTSRLGKLYQQSKELVVFYKDGLKLLWNNNKAAKALLQKVQQTGYEVNRAEFQLIHNNKIDMIKLIPFGFIFLILPESIPFFVIFAPGVVPSTCIKESQKIKQREKLDKLRQTMTTNVLVSSQKIKGISPEDFLSIPKFSKIAKHYDYDFDLNQIDRAHLASYCRFMGLNGWGTAHSLRKRLNKHFDYLVKDDMLISKEGVNSLSFTELQQAIEERGMRSLNLDESHLRQCLKYWLACQSIDPPVTRGLLVFSRMFLLNAKY